MSEYIKTGLKITWLAVLMYWLASGFLSKKAIRQENFFTRFIQYWFPLIIAVLLLGPGEWYGHSWLRESFVKHSNVTGITGLLLSISGAVMACLARHSLGNNWSLSVQQKKNHELIQNGLYKIVRHPIYSGLLLLFTGNAIIVGDYRGIIAVGIVLISFWFKLMKEEKILISIFGDQYIRYKHKTKAIIPFIL